MIGRGATGRPWLATTIENHLRGAAWIEPTGAAVAAAVEDHLVSAVGFYGDVLGVRTFRKHLARYIENTLADWSAQERAIVRGSLCRMEAPGDIRSAIWRLWGEPANRLAA
jgi:tRNA-dihydrouridine synthase